MASSASLKVSLSDLIRPYDGTGDVVEWFTKFEFVAELKELEHWEKIVPLLLEGKAFSVFAELEESVRKAYTKFKAELTEVFGLDPFVAYEQFIRRVWCDEPVDIFLSDLKKLAKLAGIYSNTTVTRAFIVGLPTAVSRELRATVKTGDLSSLEKVVARARSLMSEVASNPIGAVAQLTRATGKTINKRTDIKCFKCGGPHLMRNCSKPVTCWTCGQVGHLSKDCPGNDQERAVASVALSNQK